MFMTQLAKTPPWWPKDFCVKRQTNTSQQKNIEKITKIKLNTKTQ